MLVVAEPAVEVFQYNLEGNKEKSGIHKQMEKLVAFTGVTGVNTLVDNMSIFLALLQCIAQMSLLKDVVLILDFMIWGQFQPSVI